MRGGKKEAVQEEQVTIDFAFSTVVSIAPIKAGELFTEKNIWVKRPGTGPILAQYFYDVVGKKSLVDICEDHHIAPSEIENY